MEATARQEPFVVLMSVELSHTPQDNHIAQEHVRTEHTSCSQPRALTSTLKRYLEGILLFLLLLFLWKILPYKSSLKKSARRWYT